MKSLKNHSLPWRKKMLVWSGCSYQVPVMVCTNAPTNEKHKFYNATVQTISIGGVECATNIVSLCAQFLHDITVKTPVENDPEKLFDFQD